jgi:hypothetical protein
MIVVPSAALAQAWRDGGRQARLARLLRYRNARIEALDGTWARAVGEVCGSRSVTDVVDVFVALVARRYGGVVVTADPDDLRRIDPSLTIQAVL